MRTIARMYDAYPKAVEVVKELEAVDLGPDRKISLVANQDARGRDPNDRTESHGAETGAGVGAAVGAGVGLLTGIGLLAIPGIGPLVAAGWLATTLAGAATGALAGGLVGALVDAGVSREEAEVYQEGVRRGATLVAVQVEDEHAPKVETMMDRHAPTDWRMRREEYVTSGWQPSAR
jgi:uncharacterized membrane protein